MTTSVEYADLARRMERYPEEFAQDVDDDDDFGSNVGPNIGISPDTREWDLCVEALKQAAERK